MQNFQVHSSIGSNESTDQAKTLHLPFAYLYNPPSFYYAYSVL